MQEELHAWTMHAGKEKHSNYRRDDGRGNTGRTIPRVEVENPNLNLNLNLKSQTSTSSFFGNPNLNLKSKKKNSASTKTSTQKPQPQPFLWVNDFLRESTVRRHVVMCSFRLPISPKRAKNSKIDAHIPRETSVGVGNRKSQHLTILTL